MTLITLLSLVGEQPMPVLLPDRFLQPARRLLICTERTRPVAERLQRLLPHGRVEATDAYDLPAILARLGQLAQPDEETIVNLTGGTKMMMLAAFALAMQHDWDFVYLESEHPPQLLHRYSLAGGHLRRVPAHRLPELIKAADYLQAHLPGFQANGFSRDEIGRLTTGGHFEAAVFDALASHFEVLAGVRPEGVANQIELDLVIRLGNQVGVAEVKLGGGDERPKQGIDQLSTAASREYLGTYTAKFLITAGRPGRRVQELAAKQQVTLIAIRDYQLGRPIAPSEQVRLVQAVRQRLAG